MRTYFLAPINDFLKLSQLEKIILLWLISGWFCLLFIGLLSGQMGVVNFIPELARVNIFMISVNGLLVLELVQVFLRGELPVLNAKQKQLLSLLAVFLLWVIICSVLGTDFQHSLWGNEFRRDGLVTLINLILFACLVGLGWTTKLQKLFGSLIGWSGWLVAVSYIFSNWLSAQNAAGFGSTVYLSGFLLLTLPFMWFACDRLITKLVSVGIIVVAIVMTGSTGAVLGVGLFFALLLSFKLKRRANIFQLALIVMVVISAVSIWTIASQRDSYEGRPRVMTKLWLATSQQPIQGWGYANVDQAFKAVDWPYPVRFDIYVDKAHSHLLEVLVVAGWPGLVMYVTLLSLAGYYLFIEVTKKNYLNNRKLTILVAFVLYVFHTQTNVVSIMEEIIFWFCLGVIISLINSSHQSGTAKG